MRQLVHFEYVLYLLYTNKFYRQKRKTKNKKHFTSRSHKTFFFCKQKKNLRKLLHFPFIFPSFSSKIFQHI